MAQEHHNNVLISNEVVEQLTKWQEEAPEKRAVIVIALEDEGDNRQCVENLINGNGRNLIDAMHATVSDHDKRNSLAKLMRRAVSRFSFEIACGQLERCLNELQAQLKAGSEEETKEEEDGK